MVQGLYTGFPPFRMLLRLTVIDSQNRTRKLYLQIKQPEQGFDVVNHIVASAEKLMSAQLVDGKTVVDLPVDSFDPGLSVEQNTDLEREWQAVLKKPHLTATEFYSALLEITRKQLAACESRIARFEPLVSRIDALLAHVQTMNISREARQTLENNYEQALSRYRQQLANAYLTHQHLLDLINKLM